MKNKITHLIGAAAILLCVLASVTDADAQRTRRRKKPRPRVVAATVQPIQTAAADDQPLYLDGNQIILGEAAAPSETTGSVPIPPQPISADEAANVDSRVRELTDRIRQLESSQKNNSDDKQKRLLMNLDILTRAESRAESLRKQLFEMIEKQSGVQTRLEQIRNDARPEVIERSTAFLGSLRPEEIREQRRKSLEAERTNLESLVIQIQINRAVLEENVQKADYLVEKVRLKLDKEIDDALADDKDQN